jgi:hypothetical protein
MFKELARPEQELSTSSPNYGRWFVPAIKEDPFTLIHNYALVVVKDNGKLDIEATPVDSSKYAAYFITEEDAYSNATDFYSEHGIVYPYLQQEYQISHTVEQEIMEFI